MVCRVGQSDEVNTLIDEVNEEYPFWRPHQDKEYPFFSIHASTKEVHHEDLIADLYANDLAITDPGVVLNEDGNSVLIADDDDDNNPPPLPLEPNLPCMHFIIGEVNEDFQFWTDIPNGEPHSDNMYNNTVQNQANNNMPTNGESLLLRSFEDLDRRDNEASTNDTVLEQSNEVHTLIDEVNEEYSFWRSHQDKEYPVDSIPVSHEIDTAKYHSSTEAVPTITSAPVNRTDIVSNEDATLNLTVVTAAAAATDDDDNSSNVKLKLDGETSIGNLNGIQQEYLTEYEASSHGNNYYDNEYGVFLTEVMMIMNVVYSVTEVMMITLLYYHQNH